MYFEFINNFYFAAIALILGFAGFIAGALVMPCSRYERGALPVFLLGLAVLVVGCIAFSNAMAIKNQQDTNRTIAEEANLTAPALVDRIDLTNYNAYRVNDTEALAVVTMVGRGKVYDISAKSYGKPENLSRGWRQISKSIIPETKETIPAIWRAAGDNGTLVFMIKGNWGSEYAYIEPWA